MKENDMVCPDKILCTFDLSIVYICFFVDTITVSNTYCIFMDWFAAEGFRFSKRILVYYK